MANLICWDALNVEGKQGIQRAAYLLDHSGRVGYSNSNNATFNATPHRPWGDHVPQPNSTSTLAAMGTSSD